MSTTQFHKMQAQPLHRTEIRIVASVKTGWCHHCHKDVQPKVIISAFVSNLLYVCPKCSSVIQEKTL